MVEYIPTSSIQNPFVQYLAQMDSRICFYNRIGEIDKNHGYLPTKERILIPAKFPLATHELAHIVEMRDFARLTVPDFGMKVFGRFKRSTPLYRASDSGFFAGVARETRVRAIEAHFEAQSIAESYSLLRSAQGISGWGRDALTRLPYGRFRSEQQLEDWTRDLFDKTFRAWNKDRIVVEWKERLQFLKNWMDN